MDFPLLRLVKRQVSAVICGIRSSDGKRATVGGKTKRLYRHLPVDGRNMGVYSSRDDGFSTIFRLRDVPKDLSEEP